MGVYRADSGDSRALIRTLQNTPRLCENVIKHLRGQAAGQRVVLAGVVRGQKGNTAIKLVCQAVAEFRAGRRKDGAMGGAYSQVGVKRYFTQGHNHPGLFQQFQLADQVWGAVGPFHRQGLVVGWGATDSGSDVGVAQRHAIVPVMGHGGAGEAKLMQRPVNPVAASVPGEHAAGAVGAVGRRGQSQKHQPGCRVSKAWNGPPPIFPVLVH